MTPTAIKRTNSTPTVRMTTATSFVVVWLALFTCFVANVSLHWPELYNIVTLGLRDLGSFVYLDTLLAKHLRLGVDVGYTYGLLPVLIQHLLSIILTNGYLALLVFDVFHLLAMSFGWAVLWRATGSSLLTLAALLAFSPFLAMGTPHAAHALLQGTIFGAIVCLFLSRLQTAFIFAVIGCLSMPSLPIALTCFLLGYLVILILCESDPKNRLRLARIPLPATIVFVAGAAILAGVFSWGSLLATLSPGSGAEHYNQIGYGVFRAGRAYLFPPGVHLGYYAGTKVGWWLLSTAILAWCAFRAARSVWIRKQISAVDSAVLMCFSLHLTFIFFAFGTGFQTMYYDPILVAGILISFNSQSQCYWGRAMLVAMMVCGIFAHTSSVRGALIAWKNTSRYPSTKNLYAPSAFATEWKPILDETKSKRLLVLSTGRGISYWYPQIDEPDSWFLLPGMPKPIEKQRLIAKIRQADFVAEELKDNMKYVDSDQQVQDALSRFRNIETGTWFRIYRK